MNLRRKLRHYLLKLLYLIGSIPFIFLGLLLLFFNYDSLKSDLRKVLLCINNYSDYDINHKSIVFLVFAEDHRYYEHYGVDFIAILRAIYVFYKSKKYQGASTIEQQFVRTITRRYEKTKKRKFREQILSLMVYFYIKDKDLIAKCYLYLAFYGSGLDGLVNFLHKKKRSLYQLSDDENMELISRLKYPEPLIASKEWNRKIHDRVKYTQYRYSKYIN